MNDSEEEIDFFFDQYEQRFNDSLVGKLNVADIASCFAVCFLEAHPKGIICGKNDEEFKKAIPQGYEFYRRIGVTSMKITSTETTRLNSLHWMVKVNWKMMYKRKDDLSGAIEFEVIYFLQKNVGQLKIFSYITGDEEAVLKQHELI